MPGQLYDINSKYGSRTDLITLTSVLRDAGITPMADIVINHRSVGCAVCTVHVVHASRSRSHNVERSLGSAQGLPPLGIIMYVATDRSRCCFAVSLPYIKVF